MTQRGTLVFSLSDALDMFLLDCASRRLSDDSLEFYKSKLSVFIRWCDDNEIDVLDDVSAHDIRRFLVDVQRRGLSGQYQHNLARAILAFLNYCVRDELLERSPFDKIQMSKVEKKILSALTKAEIGKILKSCERQRDLALCLFLLDSGVRASELAALDVGDIDLQSGVVLVRYGKGQKGRSTYIGAKTRKELKRYFVERGRPKPHEPAFAAVFTGNRLTRDGLVQLMGRIRERTQVDQCTCHAFRRTFAITCLRNGMNIYVLSRLMGHADIAILRQYLAFIEEDLEQAHAKYGAVDHLFG